MSAPPPSATARPRGGWWRGTRAPGRRRPGGCTTWKSNPIRTSFVCLMHLLAYHLDLRVHMKHDTFGALKPNGNSLLKSRSPDSLKAFPNFRFLKSGREGGGKEGLFSAYKINYSTAAEARGGERGSRAVFQRIFAPKRKNCPLCIALSLVSESSAVCVRSRRRRRGWWYVHSSPGE